jgi:hypothetical protein
VRLRQASIPALAVGVAMATIVISAGPAPAALENVWTTVPDVPLPVNAAGGELHDVAVNSATDVWAVGAWWDTARHPLAVHGDGATWTVVPTPDATTPQDEYELTAIDATGPADAWAVGRVTSFPSGSTVGSATTLMLHYDGTGWSTGLSTAGAINDVDLTTSGENWAVGQTAADGQSPQPLILHLQAGIWRPVTVPLLGAPSAVLSSVYVTTAKDIWAVGSQVRPDGLETTLVLHFDGLSWQPVTVPDPGTSSDSETLSSVAVGPSGEVWAVGRICSPKDSSTICHSLALRRFSGVWQVIPTAGSGTELKEVIPLSSIDVWVIGYVSTVAGRDHDHTEHWDGIRFTSAGAGPAPTATSDTGNGDPASALVGASVAPGSHDIWAVGWMSGVTQSSMTHGIRHG